MVFLGENHRERRGIGGAGAGVFVVNVYENRAGCEIEVLNKDSVALTLSGGV